MSYRSFKRVLGETSLERKCRFLFGGCLLVLITGSFWWYGYRTDQLVYEQNRRAARAWVDAAMALVHWDKLENVTSGNKPLAKEIFEDIRNKDYKSRFIKPENPKKVGRPQDEREWKLLEQWNKLGQLTTPEEQQGWMFEERHLPEKGEYQYFQPIFAKRECIDCHRVNESNPYIQDGDLLAIAQVTLSDKDTIKAQNANRAFLLVTAIVTVFLAMIALYVIVRYVIVKPLKHLRDVSNEIRRGNINQRAMIHTGDEFEELAAAFNRMLRHMVSAQEKLKQVNANLDGKVDELAQANMRLYEMNRLKSDFLATVSHELRTPLNSIIGFSDVLRAIESLDDKQQRYVQNIQRSGRMLLEMINDILDLAKIESGKMNIKPSEFRIEQVIAAQCDMARPLAERKNIDLSYRVEPDLPPLFQDQSKVQQILNNLLSNAIKFTPEGGRIAIAAGRNDDGELALVVEDTGVGIGEEDQKVIFEKFRQGKTAIGGGDAMTREYSGTGLGLSIVRELCRLLGGEILLKSELGKGSTFTVKIPWTRSEETPIASGLARDLEKLSQARRLHWTGGTVAPTDAPVGQAF